MLLPFVLACATANPPPAAPAPPPAPTLSFESLASPTTADERQILRTTPNYLVNGNARNLRWQTLTTDGQMIGGARFGDVVDPAGRHFVATTGGDLLCRSPDYAGLLRAHGSWHLVQHVECIPGAIYISPLAQDPAGLLSPTATRPADLFSEGGTFNPCAGDTTPWGTHLSSEEYEPDARNIGADGLMNKDDWGYNSIARQLGVSATEVDPYDYGWLPEITVTDAIGKATGAKHYAMGRFSHELGLVMPDERTVYMSDDGKYVGLFLFVADKARDLSAGTLYAARWDQQPDGAATIAWLSLGHATDADLRAAVRERQVRIDELFDIAEPAGGACAAGWTPSMANGRAECLRVRPGQELLASRLESRRYAATLGATLEFQKGEGLALDPRRRVIYYATSEHGDGMLEGKPGSGTDHIRLPANRCGAIMALMPGPSKDHLGRTIDSPWAAITATTALAGAPVSDPPEGADRCATDGIANPDNLGFIPEADLLLIAEDTRNHLNASLWAWHVPTATLIRLASAPYAGEMTGIGWYPDVGGHGYITLTVQHPFEPGKMPKGIPVPPGEHRTFTGVLGPIDLR